LSVQLGEPVLEFLELETEFELPLLGPVILRFRLNVALCGRFQSGAQALVVALIRRGGGRDGGAGDEKRQGGHERHDRGADAAARGQHVADQAHRPSRRPPTGLADGFGTGTSLPRSRIHPMDVVPRPAWRAVRRRSPSGPSDRDGGQPTAPVPRAGSTDLRAFIATNRAHEPKVPEKPFWLTLLAEHRAPPRG